MTNNQGFEGGEHPLFAEHPFERGLVRCLFSIGTNGGFRDRLSGKLRVLFFIFCFAERSSRYSYYHFESAAKAQKYERSAKQQTQTCLQIYKKYKVTSPKKMRYLR